ncbi:single-stranded DNA-binding protein [Bacillaceae bacterium CLA-AA-H227]|uniref:Single-stranded DNA-binding protein n=2 Tax=Robertmurraya TaxID=2837507 RepID=A0A4U1CZ51_9BACI|nr:single-stranded DNA-binding protein [Robertmurraya kyonggiensis]TKC15121.1 single-stranded DNA-binding protein [Robertmurraya kyonggiensis]
MLNECRFIGNLTKDVELRHTTEGTPVANLDLALNYFAGNEKKTEYIQITVWKKRAEDCAKFLTKGRQVYVEAKVVVRKRNYDGKNIPVPEFHADNVLFLGPANSNSGNDAPQDPFGNQSPHEQVFGQSGGVDPFSNPFGGSANGGNNQNPFQR